MSHRFSLNHTLHNAHSDALQLPGCETEHDRTAVCFLNENGAPLTAPPELPLRPAESIFVPEGYEPNYAYPLILWVLDPASGEHELCRLMAQISTRNYFGLSLRTPLAGGKTTAPSNATSMPNSSDVSGAPGEGAPVDEDASMWEFEQQLLETVQRVRSEYHIHSERVYLAGFDAAATLSLRLGLRRPDWFAGVAAFAAKFPNTPHPLSRFRDLRGKRVLLGWGERDPEAASINHRTGRMLHSAGMRVCLRTYDAGLEITRPMLLDVDRWVMREIYEPAMVGGK